MPLLNRHFDSSKWHDWLFKRPRPVAARWFSWGLLYLFALSGHLSGTDTAAPAGPRVFVCGHSFMIFTAQLLPPLAQAAHLPYVAAGSQMLGGSRVIQHWDLPDERNPAKTALRNGRVDVLTLSPHVLLPDPGIDQFAKLGVASNPRLRVLVQASWPAHDGIKDRAFHNAQRNASTVTSLRRMQEAHHQLWLGKLEAQVRALNQAIGRDAVGIIPVSDAVFALRERIADGKAPGLTQQTDLFSDDLGHPQLPLAELVAYCHFAAIYQRSPVGLPVPEKLQGHAQAPELNRLLQQLAWDAVKNHPLGGVPIAGPTDAHDGAASAPGAAP